MISIIVSGHGSFASGLKGAVQLIIGEQEQISFIDFSEGVSPEQLRTSFESAISSMNRSDGVLFLTDLLGGTPFRVASTLSHEYSNKIIKVISGTNLQMILETILERNDFTIQTIVSFSLASGKKGITSLDLQLEKQNIAQKSIQLDGI